MQPSNSSSKEKSAKIIENYLTNGVNEPKSELAESDLVCTTADCWTAVNKSFLGITVHWINKTNISERKSAAIACRRILGSHTHNVLATVTVPFSISGSNINLHLFSVIDYPSGGVNKFHQGP